MSNQIVPFVAGKLTQAPAHTAKFFESHKNIDERFTVNQLSFRGKVWRIVINGEEKPLLNNEGDPVQVVHVVMLDHNKARSRAYYEGAYEEGKSQRPACWATDGEVPDAEVPHPVAKSCQACPNSKKGSKITPNGKETTKCGVFKRIALVPLQDIESEPLLLRLAQTSVWDKNNDENEAKGWYAWDQYIDMLRKNGADHTAAVATKIKFDHRMAYPKLLFAASRWLVDDELGIVNPLIDDERVGKLLQAPETSIAARKPKDADPDAGVDDDEAPSTSKGESEYDDETPAPTKKTKAKAAPAEDEEAPPPPKKAKAAPPPAEDEEAPPPPAAKKARRAPAEDEEEAPPPAAAKKAVAAKGKGGNGKGGAGLADLVSDWETGE